MAALREALKAHLLADSPLMALMTGGVLDAEDLPQAGGDMSTLPLEANGITIKPFIVPRWRLKKPGEIISISQYRTLELYFYADTGYSVIEPAMERVIGLLHRQRLQADDVDGYAFFEWIQDRGEAPAPEFGNAASDMSRYTLGNLRRS